MAVVEAYVGAVVAVVETVEALTFGLAAVETVEAFGLVVPGADSSKGFEDTFDSKAELLQFGHQYTGLQTAMVV